MIRSGQGVNLPAAAIVTPAARELLRELERNGTKAVSTPVAAPAARTGSKKLSPPTKKLTSKSPKSELEAFFNSPDAHRLKEQICEMGRRMWQREYVDGNGGNMAIRVGDDIAICTPTLVSKGSLQPSDLCLVDFDGTQLLGTKKRTSEILMHLQMMKRQPKAVATCHCHPPCATAFTLTGQAPPRGVLTECDLFCSVALAPYRTPGSPELGEVIAGLAGQHDTILMANHGVVTWSHNHLEEAYWRVEIIENHCRTLVAASQLGKPLASLTGAQIKELLDIKQGWGFVDARYGLKESELCDRSK
jgi:L-fuculose-phosphate aldolase